MLQGLYFIVAWREYMTNHLADLAESPAGSPKMVAAQLYLKLRKRIGHAEALSALAARPGMPDLKMLKRWASDDGWSALYERDQAVSTLSEDEFKSDYHLQQLRAHLRNAKDILDYAYNRAATVDAAGDWVATGSDLKQFTEASKTWREALDSLWEAEQRFRRSRIENRLPLDAIQRKSALVNELLEEYGDGGPQYRHLIDLLASASLRMEQLERSDRDVTNTEYAELAKLKLQIITQLQKHTESTKSESLTKEVNEVAKEFIKLADRYFGKYSTEFEVFVKDLIRVINSREMVA